MTELLIQRSRRLLYFMPQHSVARVLEGDNVDPGVAYLAIKAAQYLIDQEERRREGV